MRSLPSRKGAVSIVQNRRLWCPEPHHVERAELRKREDETAVIFNALIIIGLIPLALKGIAHRPLGAAALLRRNVLVYGLGGVVLPFVGIKVVDMLLAVTGLA